jgi:hypothetical protein
MQTLNPLALRRLAAEAVLVWHDEQDTLKRIGILDSRSRVSSDIGYVLQVLAPSDNNYVVRRGYQSVENVERFSRFLCEPDGLAAWLNILGSSVEAGPIREHLFKTHGDN